MTTPNQLPTETCDYLLKLGEHHQALKLVLPKPGFFDQRLALLYVEVDEIDEKVRKLQLLTRWHKILSGNVSTSPEQLKEVEDQILEIFNQPEPEIAPEVIPELPVSEPDVTPAPEAIASEVKPTETAPTPVKPENTPVQVNIPIGELVKTFNYLLQLGNHYLGTGLTANYWKSSRPEFDWLDNFAINPSNQMMFAGSSTDFPSPVQLHWFQKWIKAYIESCSKIIQDFPKMIDPEKMVGVQIKKNKPN
jgi:hypothetical protein